MFTYDVSSDAGMVRLDIGDTQEGCGPLPDKANFSDEEIDALYTSLFRELLTYMMEDPRTIGPCAHLLFVAKNIERIGDHSTNIAETVHFLVHGKPIDETRPKGDTTNVAING